MGQQLESGGIVNQENLMYSADFTQGVYMEKEGLPAAHGLGGG